MSINAVFLLTVGTGEHCFVEEALQAKSHSLFNVASLVCQPSRSGLTFSWSPDSTEMIAQISFEKVVLGYTWRSSGAHVEQDTLLWFVLFINTLLPEG